MTEVIAGLLILCGGAFAIIASLGVVKLPDTLTRMHASTKAGTLSSALILSAAALLSGEPGVVAKCAVAILFLLLTAPLAAHMLGRASLGAERHPRLPEGEDRG